MSTTAGPIDLLDKFSVGCFADDADDRDLSFHMFISGSDMTVEKCQTACRQQAFKYAGLQVRRLCYTWWRHQMETFSALLAICAGNSPVPGEFSAQRLVTRSFDVVFDLHLNKRLSKQSWGWWFETPSHPLWRHRNERLEYMILQTISSNIFVEGKVLYSCSNLTETYPLRSIIWKHGFK